MAKIFVQLAPDSPIIEMDESELVKTIGGHDNEDEKVDWIEYRLASDPNAERAIHRSVTMILKKPAVFADGAVAGFV